VAFLVNRDNGMQVASMQNGKSINKEPVVRAQAVHRFVQTIGKVLVFGLETANQKSFVVATGLFLNGGFEGVVVLRGVVDADGLEERDGVAGDDVDEGVVVGTEFAFSRLVQGLGAFCASGSSTTNDSSRLPFNMISTHLAKEKWADVNNSAMVFGSAW